MSLEIAVSGVGGLLVSALASAVKSSAKLAETGDIEKLKAEEVKQEIALRMSEFQARVSQEIAIARRIDTAEEVEIEEFYDTSGQGGIGINANNDQIYVGANGSGRRVVKRIYRFKGWHDGGMELHENKTLVTEQD
ncbi:hypothetical protein [Sporomusa sp.]|uniref:hypothetical protein n=1 Tax=Sporomusa sp. TaxID=2078658 RepID=UPI002C102B43|nr:hypothetical protein [Sporomusa sp.]HWR44206.1 hypothetical protein [Sporomusa sp.]